ncbi:STAS domain-containing protein [Cellulomonas aerilata]|uniref:STAS domain-containing protein n=1 Tax=Cellulomonas aerilata TaxID=515326 RepID=UPI001649A325|nr:STAS domain-containing protein [Cellulomonas aerilata]
MSDLDPIRSIEPGERTIVHLAGELDAHTAPSLRAGLEDLLHAGHVDLLLDLAAVRFADSTGLGVLVGALKKAVRREARLELAAPAPVVLKILRMTSLDRVFTVHDSIDDALRA